MYRQIKISLICIYIFFPPNGYSSPLRTLTSYSVSYRILVGNPDGKRPLGRPRRRWVDNIKMDLREIGWDGWDSIDLAQDRDQWRALVKAVMNLRVP
jgi:hypothetical protein